MAENSSDTEEPDSSVIFSKFNAAIDNHDPSELFQLIVQHQFVLISITAEDDEEDDEAMGAITAEVEDYEVLVAFTSEPLAGQFVEAMGDMFGETDQVQGFIVEGDALLDYLPDNYGLLLNPETEFTAIVEPDLAQAVIASTETR